MLRARYPLGQPCRGAPDALSWPSPGHISACARPCRGRVAVGTRALARRLAALCCNTRPCHKPLPVTIQNLNRDPRPCRTHSMSHVVRTSSCLEAPNAVSWHIVASYSGALLRRIVAHCCAVSQPLCAISRPKVDPLSHDTIFFCIATQGPPSSQYKLCIAASSPGQAARALRIVSHRPPRPCRAHCRLYRGRAQLCRAHLLAPPEACVPSQPVVCLLSLLSLLYCDSILENGQ